MSAENFDEENLSSAKNGGFWKLGSSLDGARRFSIFKKKRALTRSDRKGRRGLWNLNRFTAKIEINPIGLDSNLLLEGKNLSASTTELNFTEKSQKKNQRPLTFWHFYCYFATFAVPSRLLIYFGMKKAERRMAWREKVALLTIILYLGLFVSFLTFQLTRTLCNESRVYMKPENIDGQYLIVGGNIFNFQGTQDTEISIDLQNNTFLGPFNASGKDASFLFQNVNGHCLNVITPSKDSKIPHDSEGNMERYFPYVMTKDGVLEENKWNHTHLEAQRNDYYSLRSVATVFFTWEEIRNSKRNLIVYNGAVLDLDLIKWLQNDQISTPLIFDDMLRLPLEGYDLSVVFTSPRDKRIAMCLTEIIQVGVIDSQTIGCITSTVVLYLSLIFILAVVFTKFFVACYFRWIVAMRQGAFTIHNKEWVKHCRDVEQWSKNIDINAPLKKVDPPLRPIIPSRFGLSFNKRIDLGSAGIERTPGQLKKKISRSNWDSKSVSFNEMTTMTLQKEHQRLQYKDKVKFGKMINQKSGTSMPSPSVMLGKTLSPQIIHSSAVKQPPVEYMPFGIPLIHTICFVTCYSEDERGLRITLDSLATTDYPSSHKLLMVVCDGLIKGSENSSFTSDLVIGMMEDFVILPEDVLPYSYISVASGWKRHNMAKVYAGFYKYDETTVGRENQQRVPMIIIVKCGTETERLGSKPGNRGKRDSQVILMSFLQKVTFDERMTELEYHILKSIWQVTGLMAELYEAVLMVDADTKIFPDSLTHMVAELVKDPEIMGLCGETKIANKKESWVTAIQVFEYYISHHQVKAFESVFNSVTCLPGCFSIYRIKSPKGHTGYWVPILANPDIIEKYSDNDIRSLHKKNLLLLGEDRYLSFLMLKMFPKRKQIFVPKAVCKTTVPSEFKVLLSQRRRWINSTVHNLLELVLVRDLCGTFCFSMRFVIAIELLGTLILPSAICFTIYVILFSIFSSPTPIVTLILLGIILGLPGVLVVITSTKWSYVVWMLVYLLALPMWNFVLPTYAFWKFDDFSWGDTRLIFREENKTPHHESEGTFDFSKLFLKPWTVFEEEEVLACSVP
ncbi:uncharacterized protein KNAG_0K01330 [Huiozyma naganishii CBS 8797]|uniref:chitin synthase n=1 Tax=Huiozyma naganishii (strain ATCC MYA-139 / BCRC 22969 / CBS 8797 / KCTC 17520 / NBRC 10181 / NCYC 3082 / Yp74L-3) TaxID=1071383 RepID=J7RRN0_HUIN7|nr:hypothetical protein KNAG_0K01330 [Kazachstania naganishii CBS 8797]CCK72498.1 hypothetical protein KNAG_0K01330 [Kazachstania naganishii CBS 8797]